MFIQRVAFQAAQGKAQELRALLEERVKLAQSQGRPASLAVEVFGAGGSYVLALRYDTLSDLEARRTALASDSGFQAWAAKVAVVTREPAESDLLEVLIPFPS
jgi:hypothetical protein